MRFKHKRYRTVHKACKNCIMKQGIQCNYLGYDNDGEGGCYYNINKDWPFKYDEPTDKDRQLIIHSRRNWKRLHRKEAQEELNLKIHDDIEFRKP